MNSKPQSNYGYVIVATSTIILLVAYGTNYSYSVFFNALLIDFQESSAVISGAFSITILIAGAMAMAFGSISNRLGTRKICILSGIFLGAGYLLMSITHSIWQVYLIYGTLLAAGIGGLWPAILPNIARWFDVRRGLMTGITTTGVGIGSAVFPPLISFLIINYTWRTTYIIIGLITLIVMVCFALLLKPKSVRDQSAAGLSNAKGAAITVNHEYTFRQIMRMRQFWILNAINFLVGYSQFSVMVHIVPFASGRGISLVSAASVFTVIGMASIVGRLVSGIVTDKIKAKPSFIVILSIFLVSMVWLSFSHQLWSLFVFGLFYGFSYGGTSTIQSLIGAEMFGLNTLGMLIASFLICIGIGGACGPIVTGYIVDVSHSYQLAFLGCILPALIALILAIIITPVDSPSLNSKSQIKN
jgi:MFS family permease